MPMCLGRKRTKKQRKKPPWGAAIPGRKRRPWGGGDPRKKTSALGSGDPRGGSQAFWQRDYWDRMLIYGHTHIGRIVSESGVWVINLGSPSRPRGGGRPTIVIAEVLNGQVHAEFKFPPQPADD